MTEGSAYVSANVFETGFWYVVWTVVPAAVASRSAAPADVAGTAAAAATRTARAAQILPALPRPTLPRSTWLP